MPYIMRITLIGLTAGVVGTGLGGLITGLLGHPRKNVISFVLAFSGGIMLAVVFYDLIPEALEYGSFTTTMFGLLMGIAFLMVLDKFIPHVHVSATSNTASARRSHFLRTSILIGVGIAVHNFPEGLAIGAGYVASPELGLGLALVLALHDIPEGLAMAGPMKAANIPVAKMIFNTALAGVPTAIGAFLGALLGAVSPIFLSFSLGFAAGAMIYLVFDELLPAAQELNEGHSQTYGALAGVVLGLVFLILL